MGEKRSAAPANLKPASERFLFEAELSVIGPGEMSLLRWNIQGATSVSIEEASGTHELHLIGKFSRTGTLPVRPEKNSTYVISCEGSTQFSCASVSVRVRVKRP